MSVSRSTKQSQDGNIGGDLIDRRKGTFDNVVPPPSTPRREHRTPHENAQSGADVRSETDPTDETTPKRLRRDIRKS